LNHWRSEGKEIKLVWYRGGPTTQPSRWTGKWEYEVSKLKLAEALWPALLRKIQRAMVTEDAPVPPIMRLCRRIMVRRQLVQCLDDGDRHAGPVRGDAGLLGARHGDLARALVRSYLVEVALLPRIAFRRPGVDLLALALVHLRRDEPSSHE
jgi:hypothetical protein